jgi:hypothetical protein
MLLYAHGWKNAWREASGCREPSIMGELWSVSQLTKESGANAFEPRAANLFMQSMDHHGDGE